MGNNVEILDIKIVSLLELCLKDKKGKTPHFSYHKRRKINKFVKYVGNRIEFIVDLEDDKVLKKFFIATIEAKGLRLLEMFRKHQK